MNEDFAEFSVLPLLDIKPLRGLRLADALKVVTGRCRDVVGDYGADSAGVEVIDGTLCGIDDKTVVAVEEEHHKRKAVFVLYDAVSGDVESGIEGNALVGSDG